jgi:hypothetical protein
MAIDEIPDWPLRSQGLTQAEYSAGVEASLSAMPTLVEQFNAAATLAQLSTTTTSSSSVAIGTGAKSFTVQTGLGYVVGMTLRLAFDSTNYMTGDITSYNSGTGALVMNITAVVGSGTRATWAISLSATGANTAGSVSFTPAGTIAATNVQTAIQELDTEKLSSAAGAVTGTNLEDIIAGSSVGSIASIPVITYDANGRVTATSSATKITLATLVATTSGTSHDFTSIPSTAKRITLQFNGVSTSGTSRLQVQIGDSGGVESTGYVAAATTLGASANSTSSTTGFVLTQGVAAAETVSGQITICLMDAATFLWSASGTLGRVSAGVHVSGGAKALSAALDRIRLTTENGTDTFDAGSINIIYE